jgi:hypothetical protein
MLTRVYLILVAFVFLLAVSANAQPVTWYLQNVTFDDGGTVRWVVQFRLQHLHVHQR